MSAMEGGLCRARTHCIAAFLGTQCTIIEDMEVHGADVCFQLWLQPVRNVTYNFKHSSFAGLRYQGLYCSFACPGAALTTGPDVQFIKAGPDHLHEYSGSDRAECMRGCEVAQFTTGTPRLRECDVQKGISNMMSKWRCNRRLQL